jgi:hypothetical protein
MLSLILNRISAEGRNLPNQSCMHAGIPHVSDVLIPVGSDNRAYGNFAGRDGAALSGLKTGSPGRHRYPFWLSLGENSLQNRQCLCGYATLSGGIGIRGTIRNACMRYPLAVQDKKIFIMGDNHARIITREG